MSDLNANQRSWKAAVWTGGTVSLAVTLATYLSLFALSLNLGTLGTVCGWVAVFGIVGFSAGMIASGNAHAGGSLAVVLTVETIVNFLLFTGIVCLLLRVVRGRTVAKQPD